MHPAESEQWLPIKQSKHKMVFPHTLMQAPNPVKQQSPEWILRSSSLHQA